MTVSIEVEKKSKHSVEIELPYYSKSSIGFYKTYFEHEKIKAVKVSALRDQPQMGWTTKEIGLDPSHEISSKEEFDNAVTNHVDWINRVIIK